MLESDLSPTCNIVREGLYRGFVSCFFLISALIRSRMDIAMAVPSIFSAVILGRVQQKALADPSFERAIEAYWVLGGGLSDMEEKCFWCSR